MSVEKYTLTFLVTQYPTKILTLQKGNGILSVILAIFAIGVAVIK